jgi:hypothetical protein
MSSRPDRRTAVRHARRMMVPCSMKRVVEDGMFEATVAIVTAAALRLIVPEPLRTNMQLAVDLPDERGFLKGQIFRATMVKHRPDHRDWFVDGLFFKKLEVAEVEGMNRRLAATYGVGWKTTGRVVRVRHEGPWLATMLNVSHSGIGLMSDRPFDAGTFLEIELPSIHRKHLKPRLIRVTHSKKQSNGTDWEVGGVFLRGLTEAELQVLL